uniref:Uncharacterized protein n=1 Tax=Romanomermis culicivorax TaxID=13658 RepID=A0A915J0C2_ROMCU
MLKLESEIGECRSRMLLQQFLLMITVPTISINEASLHVLKALRSTASDKLNRMAIKTLFHAEGCAKLLDSIPRDLLFEKC